MPGVPQVRPDAPRPPPWVCTACGITNGGWRRKCTEPTCRARAPLAEAPAAERSSRAGDNQQWFCPTCNYLNFPGRAACHACTTARPREDPKPAKPRQRAPPSRAAAASSAPSTAPSRRRSRSRARSQAKPVNGFLQSVQAEMARMLPASPTPGAAAAPPGAAAASDGPAGDEQLAALRDRIAKLSRKIERLVVLAEDGDQDDQLAVLLAGYRNEQAKLRAELAELKPLAARISTAADFRDRAISHCSALHSEVEAMERCLAAKRVALVAATQKAEVAQVELDRLVEMQRAEHARALAVQPEAIALPGTPPRPAPHSPVQWAAGLATALTGPARESFAAWMGSWATDGTAPVALEPAPVAELVDESMEADDDIELLPDNALGEELARASALASRSGSHSGSPSSLPTSLPTQDEALPFSRRPQPFRAARLAAAAPYPRSAADPDGTSTCGSAWAAAAEAHPREVAPPTPTD